MILAILAAATLVANPNVPTEAYSAPVGPIPTLSAATPAARPALLSAESTKDSPNGSLTAPERTLNAIIIVSILAALSAAACLFSPKQKP